VVTVKDLTLAAAVMWQDTGIQNTLEMGRVWDEFPELLMADLCLLSHHNPLLLIVSPVAVMMVDSCPIEADRGPHGDGR
jgi:hypothetical protein